MKKAFCGSIFVAICCLLVTVIMLLTGTGVATPDDKTEIHEMFVKAIDTAEEGESFVKIGSNPYNFCKNNPDFDKIVDMGYSILPQLKEILEPGDKVGLDGYMVCIAIEEIVNVDLKTFEAFQWDSSRTFDKSFDKFLNRLPGMVNGILSSDKDNSIKAEEIKKLGVLAIPYALDSNKCNAEVIEVMGDILGNTGAAQSKAEFVQKNKADIDMLKKFCDGVKRK